MKLTRNWNAHYHLDLSIGSLRLPKWHCSCCSVVQSCSTLCNPMDCSTPGFPVLHQFPELGQTHVHWVGDAIQPSHPLLPPFPPALNLFQYQSLFQWVSSSPRWPKYWSFSFSISPSNGYSGLISLRIDWFDLFAVQGTLKNLLQHHSSKASILQCSVFFMVQLSHPYMTPGKNIALAIWTIPLEPVFLNSMDSFLVCLFSGFDLYEQLTLKNLFFLFFMFL